MTADVELPAIPRMGGGDRWREGPVESMGYADAGTYRVNSSGTMVGVSRYTSNSGPATTTLSGGMWSMDTPFETAFNNVWRLNAINDNGIAVGRGTNGPVRWDTSTAAFTQLGVTTSSTVGNALGEAFAINQSGVAIGYVYSVGAGTRAARWNPSSSEAVELQPAGLYANNFASSSARDINVSGMVVGYSSTASPAGNSQGYRATRWANGSVEAQVLPTLAGTTAYSADFAYAVNASGTTVGLSMYQSQFRAVRWSADGENIERLGSSVDGTASSFAWDVNDVGSAVGWSEGTRVGRPNGIQAMRWDAHSAASVYLQNPRLTSQGTAKSMAVAINELGYAAGTALGTNGIESAMLWRPDTSYLDLNSLIAPSSGWYLWEAHGVTNTGFVNGYGYFDEDGTAGTPGVKRLFLMLVPEAGTYGLGDADFDTDVDFADLLLLAQHYGQSNTSLDVHVADLNLDGVVNFTDLLALAQNYGSVGGTVGASGSLSFAGDAGATGDFARDWALAQSMVPEPAGLLLGSLMPIGVRRRR